MQLDAYSNPTQAKWCGADKNHQICHKLHGRTVRNWPMVNRFTVAYCDKESFYCLFVIAVVEKIGKRERCGWSGGPGQPVHNSCQQISDLLVRKKATLHLQICSCELTDRCWCKCTLEKKRRHFPLSRFCFVLFLSWDRWHEWRRGLVALFPPMSSTTQVYFFLFKSFNL